MKYWMLLMLAAVLLPACRKGKKLPQTIYVYYEPVTTVSLWPQGNFDLFDPYDIYEVPQSPQYINYADETELANQFNSDLAFYMDQNNIILTQDSAAYELDVTSLSLSESLGRQSYVDSCGYSEFSTTKTYVYYSGLEFSAYASLYKNGVLIDSWHRTASSSEEVRNKTDKCNKPKIRSIWCGPSCLGERVAKEIRKKVSRKIYEVEGY